MPESTPQQEERLHLVVLQKTFELLTAAFSLIAALAWNDAIQSLFKAIFGEASSLYAKFLYAILITVVIVVLVQRVSSLTQKAKDRLTREAPKS